MMIRMKMKIYCWKETSAQDWSGSNQQAMIQEKERQEAQTDQGLRTILMKRTQTTPERKIEKGKEKETGEKAVKKMEKKKGMKNQKGSKGNARRIYTSVSFV